MATRSQAQTAPPLACVALAVVFVLVALWCLAIDRSIPLTLEQAGGSSVPEVSAVTMLGLRACFALIHLGMLAYMYNLPTFEFNVKYNRGMGSLLQDETLSLHGAKRMYTFFTIWTYSAQGLFFALGALCSAALAFGRPGLAGAGVVRLAHYLFEMTAGCGCVVSVVTAYVIWPELVRKRAPHDLHEPWNLTMHNMNLFEILAELLVGALPLSYEHAAIGMLWGVAFIGFSWAHAPELARLAKQPAPGSVGKWKGNGGNFPYFFLDWTLPVPTQYACYLGLLGTLLAFYYGAMGLRHLLGIAAGAGVPLWARAVALTAIGALCTKWRD